jgi:hypothetical protein
MDAPALSAVCLLGSRRERLPKLTAALAAQTAAGELELVLVGGEGDEGIALPPGIRRKQVTWPPNLSFGDARALGAREATGEIVAFLLDHCYPEPGWAEALIDAYRTRPWAAVGYSFRNANPETYGSRAVFIANFGPWQGAGSGEASLLPGNDVSYRRDQLLALGSELGELLEIDATIHRRFLEEGLSLAVESRAVVREECLESVTEACRANACYARVLAVRRASAEGWSAGRRLLSAVVAPLLATAVRLRRIWSGSTGRRDVLACTPPLLAICLGWGLGESAGYLLGDGGAARRLVHWELEANRADR